MHDYAGLFLVNKEFRQAQMTFQEKEEIRQLFYSGAISTSESPLSLGVIAERIRKLGPYKSAGQVFVSPGQALTQVCINALIDGKELVMPGPGLKEGFFLLRPYEIPFAKLSYAVSFKGLPKFGEKISMSSLAGLVIDLLVTDALYVRDDGYFLGDGNGFFDLSYALLINHGSLAPDAQVIVVQNSQFRDGLQFCPEEWDIPAHVVVLPSGVQSCAEAEREKRKNRGEIVWKSLPMKRVKKISPLWHLYIQQLEEHRTED